MIHSIILNRKKILKNACIWIKLDYNEWHRLLIKSTGERMVTDVR